MHQQREYGLHDDGNAQRLVAAYGHRLRYVSEWQKWIYWDSRRWTSEGEDSVMQLARDVARRIGHESERFETSHGSDAVRKHARASLAKNRLEAMIQLASYDPAVRISAKQLDANDFLLNVRNGVVDLRDGSLLPHSPDLRLTKLTDVSFDPLAKSNEWERFLYDVSGEHTDLPDFLQKLVGYALTGSTKEERLFFLYGPGGTGKSTFLDAIQNMLGEYSRTADFDTFVARKQVGPRHDIARLAGARLVSSVEPNRGDRLSEGLIKQITGGDLVTARHLYSESFEFRPRFKLLLVANDRPLVDHDDDAMWRRIVEIPFVATVPANKVNRWLKTRLRNDSNASAILAWAVAGCLKWQKDGLAIPPSVQSASREYRKEMDIVADFVADACETSPHARIEPRLLHDAYRVWSSNQTTGNRLPRNTFYRELEKKGFARSKSNGIEYFGGLKLRVAPAETLLRSAA